MEEIHLDLGEYAPFESIPGCGRWRYERRLPLRTDGQLRVLALGVGSAFSQRMYQSNFIVIKGQTALFIDIGTLAPLRMGEFGLTAHDVRHILITHSHADHVGGLEEIALKRRYEAPFLEVKRLPAEPDHALAERMRQARVAGQFRPSLYVPETYASDLWEMSLRGGLAFSEEIENLGPRGMMALDHYFNLVPPKYDRASESWLSQIGDIRIRTFLTQHVPDTAADSGMYTTGMIIDERLFISGDTKFDPKLIEKHAGNAEVLWHDAQHFPGGVHAFYGDLKTLPAGIKSRMYLYHLSDGMLGVDVKADGFAGLVKTAPTVYDFR